MASKRKPKVKSKPHGTCPSDGKPLEFIGSAGIIDADTRWEAETDRYRCPDGHMIFIADSKPIDEAEEADGR